MNTIISVIIPVYNDKERLKKCLQALSRQSLDKKFEILVVDNGSNENVEELTNQFHEVKYFFENKTGSYAARNCGIRHSSGEILAFTDADCIPDEEWLKEGLHFLERNKDCSAGGGEIDFIFYSQEPNLIEFYDSVFGFRQKKSIFEHNYSVTANLFVRRSSFEMIGLFNNDLKSGGDVEWCRRLIQKGGKLCYIKNAEIKHPALRSFKNFKNKYARIAGGRFQKDNFKLYEVFRTSYHHFLSFKEIEKVIQNTESAKSFSKKISLIVIHFLKISIYIITYFKIYFGGTPER